MSSYYWLCLSVCVLLTCGPAQNHPLATAAFPMEATPEPSRAQAEIANRQSLTLNPPDYDTSDWTELTRLAPTVELDLRYATANNFMEQQIYDCGRCFYRPKVAKALARVQVQLKPRGLGLKMFDCYRPAPYQQRLWDILPDARYVANPKRGSVHGRGAAADLTLINLDSGVELDMGTPYDFFGERAYTTTTDLPADVLQNRVILQEVMRANGFETIRTEWWHFNFLGSRYPLSKWVWSCE